MPDMGNDALGGLNSQVNVLSDITNWISTYFVDGLIYLAIAIVVLIGIGKCVSPVMRSARRLRKGIHEYLARHPSVRSYRLGVEGKDPGAGGCTIVTLC